MNHWGTTNPRMLERGLATIPQEVVIHVTHANSNEQNNTIIALLRRMHGGKLIDKSSTKQVEKQAKLIDGIKFNCPDVSATQGE
ncbi:hypothetical protein PoB_004062200 [Plakobranchus ocellatus]|uniref:Uncharacterized protein n=1 Tax=Plakobranchus ocellatus TaxID=259542 RepID=A0AAV4B4R5_9GAST|nr:hypothetical protein PoB_004062200 [Plakobranchus ocellatus]